MTQLTQWPKAVIDAHASRYLDDLLLANIVDSDVAEKKAAKAAEGDRDIAEAEDVSPADLQQARQAHPRYANVPDDALSYLMRRKKR